MSSRREELTRVAARLFAERGYQGTSLADLADALGMQKPSLYHHIASKEDLLWEVAWDGAEAFHAGLDGVPADAPATERIRLALRAHLAVVAGQLDIATVFVREWRYLEGERRERFVAERHRYEDRIRTLFREGVEGSELRTDLDVATAALLFLSAANWAYTWLRPGSDTDSSPTGSTPRCSRACAATRLRTERAGNRARVVHRSSASPPRSGEPRARGRRSAARCRGRAASSLTVRCGITSSWMPLVRRMARPALPDRRGQVGEAPRRLRMEPRRAVLELLDAVEREIEGLEAREEIPQLALVDLVRRQERKEQRHVRGHTARRGPVVSKPDRAHRRLGLRHRRRSGRCGVSCSQA